MRTPNNMPRRVAAETTAMLDYPSSQRSWREAAACKGADTSLFFQSGITPLAAVALCDSCTVSDECADYAASTELTVGFWAGEYHSAKDLRWNVVDEHDADALEDLMDAGATFASALSTIKKRKTQ